MLGSKTAARTFMSLGVALGTLGQATGDSQCGNGMCVSATKNGSNVEYILQQQSSDSIGWMGIGFGSQMANTLMVIMWPNEDGTVTVSQRQAGSHSEPQVVDSPPRVATVTMSSTSLNGSLPQLAFTIPANNDTTQQIIYAISSTNPGSVNADADIAVHTAKGTLNLNLVASLDNDNDNDDDDISSSGSGSGSTNDTTTTTNAQTGDTQCGNGMCVTVTVNGSEVEYVLEKQASGSIGYMAIGFGRQMANTPMVILWPNDDGTITLSQRQASGHTMPEVVASPPRVANVSMASSSLTDSKPKLAFTIPANSDTSQSIIYAMSSTNPGSSSTDADIAEHSSNGVLTLSLTGSGSGSTNASGAGPFTKTQKMIIAHAVLCGVGFLVFLPFGAILARLARTFSGKWFSAHWVVQFAIAGPMIVAGVALGIAAVENLGGPHLNDHHKKGGIALLILYVVQCSLGAIIHFVKPANRTRRPPQNYFHAILGLTILGLGFWQVRTGYKEEWPRATGMPTPGAVNVVWIVWVAVVAGLYFGGLSLLPRQYRQERLRRGRNAGSATSQTPMTQL